jgi:hypothetical protein
VGRFAKRRPLAKAFRTSSGRIAQLVEQLTLNQRVPGSSPGAPTIAINDLAASAPHRRRTVLQFILQLCSRFELQHRCFSELNVAAKVVRIENGLDIFQAMAGERRDLRHRGAGDGKPYYGRPPEVVEREVGDAGAT